MEPNAKPAIESKTLWFNVIAIPFLIGGIETLVKTFEQGDVPSTWLKYAVVVIPLGNIVLRFLTSKRIDFNAPPTACWLPLAIILCAGGAAWADPPKVVCNAPVFAISGEDVFVDLRKSEGQPDRFSLKVYPELSGLKQLEEIEPGYYRLYTYVGAYTLRCLVSNADGFGEHAQGIVVRSHFPEPPPNPEPGPAPRPPVPPGPQPVPPNPQPVPPQPVPPTPPVPPQPKPEPVDGEFKVANFVYQRTKAANDPAGAVKLADIFASLSSKVAAEGITTARGLIAELHTRYKADMHQTAEWKAVWDSVMGKFTETYNLNGAGKLAVELPTSKLLNKTAWVSLLDEAERGARSAGP